MKSSRAPAAPGPSPAALDDPAAIAAADPQGMLRLAGELGTQLREGFAAGASAPDLPSAEGLRAVVVCGMGGSGVAGDVLRSLYADRLNVPVVTVKGYGLPEFCGRDALVVACSFSGDTEETVAAYSEAVARGCRVVAICAGGELAALAEADDVATVLVPGSVPAPRAALGYLVASALGILQAVGLIPPAQEDLHRAATALDDLAGELGPQNPMDGNEAKGLAVWIGGRIPVVWGSEGLAEAPALRWKTQLNENAKVPAWTSSLSELDHNEIEGWSAGRGGPFAAIVLRHHMEHPRIGARARATLDAIAGSGLDAREVWAEMSGRMETLFGLILKGDFVSTYLGILRGVDPTAIPVLSGLKARLRG